MKGQASPDYAVSAFLFSLTVLFVFFTMTQTYNSRAWEMRKAESTLEAAKLVFFLTGDEGNWTDNPLNSTSLGLRGDSGLDAEKLRWFVGMPYPHVVDRLGLEGDFKMRVEQLPSIAITSNVKDLYIKTEERANVTISFVTSENATLYAVIVGGNITYGGEYSTSVYRTSTGSYHNLRFELYPGVYTLKALAIGSGGYGAYESSFRVV